MRVLILSHDYPPYLVGGAGTFAYSLANALSRKGISVVVMAGCPAGALKTGVATARTKVSNYLEVIRIPRIDMPPTRLWYQLMNSNKIRQHLPSFDIVHAQDQSAFPIMHYCKKQSPKPWVVTVHDDPVSELYYGLRSVASFESSMRDVLDNVLGFPLSDLAIRVECKLADALVPVSQELRNEIQHNYRVDEKRIFTIHNGINITELENEAKLTTTPEPRTEMINIFYAGRLYWRKGILHLIKSLVHMNRTLKFTAYQLNIFGEGPLKRTIASLISKFNLQKNVKLRGFVTRRELITAMAKSDIVCVPSLYEACPIAMIEAMILARPLVVFDRPFSKELLRGVPEAPMARSIQDYGFQLFSLCTSEDLRRELGSRLRSMAIERFNVEKTAEKYIELYSSLLS